MLVQNPVHGIDPGNLPPPIQPSLAKRIRTGEFINFDLLLPASSPATGPNDYAIRILQSDSNDGSSISLVPRTQPKSRVFDFNTWLIALE